MSDSRSEQKEIYQKTRIAAIQMASGPNISGNLTEAGRLIERAVAAGAGLVALPENFAIMPKNDEERLAVSESPGEGPIQNFLAAEAREHGIWLIGGTLPMRAGDGRKVRAACLVFNPQGEQLGRYDKMHLFDVALENGEKYQESATFEPGNEVVVIPSPFGRIGLAVCYDLRFPELFRCMIDKGADLIVVPSAFTALTGPVHWETLVRARAIENTAYVLAPAQGGYHVSGRETHGDSMIVNPWGIILDRLPRGSGFVIGEFDPARIQTVRKSLPSVQHRRIHCQL